MCASEKTVQVRIEFLGDELHDEGFEEIGEVAERFGCVDDTWEGVRLPGGGVPVGEVSFVKADTQGDVGVAAVAATAERLRAGILAWEDRVGRQGFETCPSSAWRLVDALGKLCGCHGFLERRGKSSSPLLEVVTGLIHSESIASWEAFLSSRGMEGNLFMTYILQKVQKASVEYHLAHDCFFHAASC